MKAMILAAGVGSRLGKYTVSKPKSLQDIGGQAILEHVLTRIKQVGVTEVVLNLHHFPEQIKSFLSDHNCFGLKCHFSLEEQLLDTGGGLFRCKDFFTEEDFILHNSDIYSTFPLKEVFPAHTASGAVATLICSDNKDHRKFLFDQDNNLCGWQNFTTGKKSVIAGREPSRALGFAGIHLIAPKIFSLYKPEKEIFSIIDTYLALAKEGYSVKPYEIADEDYLDIGTPEDLEKLRDRLKGNREKE